MKVLSNALGQLNIDYFSKVKYTIFISLILLGVSVFSLSTKWLNLGLDFTGGTTVEFSANQPIDIGVARNHLAENGFNDAQVVEYGGKNSIQIKLPPSEKDNLAETLKSALEKGSDVQFNFLGQSVVGSQFGQELIDDGLYALVIVLISIMIYLSLRFQWKLALGAVAALAHDLVITLGFFSVTQLKFDLTVLAALLAVIGYSVNDTVVVFDRIRERFRTTHEQTEKAICNLAINQTMSRTLITSITTLLSVAALAIFGGPILFGFSIALLVGILIGTYSSIFVASALAIALKLKQQDLQIKGPEDIDEMP